MRKFRYVPHTADAAFIGYGKTFEEALENSALAMLGLMVDIKSVEKEKAAVKSVVIKEKGFDEKEAVWFVLQGIVSVVDAKSLNAFSFEIEKLKREKGSVSVSGKLFYKATEKDYSLLGIKAVTPHDLEVKKSKSQFSIKVVVDV